MMIHYPGGKKRYAVDIKLCAPRKYSEFRDVFCGGCGVIRALPKDVHIWLNDIHPWVYRFWLWVRDSESAIEETADRVNQIRSWKGDYRDLFNSWKESLHLSLLDMSAFRALDFWSLHQWSVGCLVQMQRRDIAAYSKVRSIDGGLKVPSLSQLKWHKERLQNAQITNVDFSKVLNASGEHVWLFVDPPYLQFANCQSPESICNLYDFQFRPKEHRRLATALRETEHHWLLTIGDNPLIRSLYKGYRRNLRTYVGCITHKARDMNKYELWYRNY